MSLSKKNGFTLIELLISISILSIVAGLSIAGFSRYASSQALTTAQSDLVSVLQTAKTNAQSQSKDPNCDEVHIQYYWYINITSSTQYSLWSYCDNTTKTDPKWYPVKSYMLPSGVTFSSSPQVIYFSPNSISRINNSNVIFFPQGNVQSVSITLTNGFATKTVTVYSDGRIAAGEASFITPTTAPAPGGR